MHNTCHPTYNQQAVEELKRMVSNTTKPDHESYDNQMKMVYLELPDKDHRESMLERAMNLIPPLMPPQQAYKKLRIEHWEQVVLNLARAAASNRWLGVAGDSSEYSRGKYQRFSYRPLHAVLDQLVSEGWLEKETGKQFEIGPRVNHYYPAQQLRELLVPYSLLIEEVSAYDGSCLTINNPDEQYRGFVWSPDHPDRIDLETINDFARGHKWACKGRIRQSFKHTPFQSGRLITPFQNLQSKHYKVRINTLINGNPIVEVDCNANHLRMYLAMHQTDVIGKDAYQPIVELSGVDREKVKSFVNKALNCATLKEAKYVSALKKPHVTFRETEQVADAFSRLYPKLSLYGQFSLTAMQLEGIIMKKVMLQGVRDGVLALPIHDAIAVEYQHTGWASSMLKEHWIATMKDYHGKANVLLKCTSSQQSYAE